VRIETCEFCEKFLFELGGIAAPWRKEEGADIKKEPLRSDSFVVLVGVRRFTKGFLPFALAVAFRFIPQN
jgi:hypothetical protein